MKRPPLNRSPERALLTYIPIFGHCATPNKRFRGALAPNVSHSASRWRGIQRGGLPPAGLMKTILTFAIALACGSASLSAAPALATTQQVLAHIASDSEWTTQIFLTNPQPTSLQLTLTTHADGGGAVALAGNPSTTIALKGYETAVFQTADSTQENSGWAEVDSSGPVVGIAIFRRHASDGKYYEGAAQLSAAYPGFIVPFDETVFAPAGQPFVNGFAITNPDPTTTAQVTCGAIDLTAAQLGGSITLTLDPLEHTAFLLDAQFGTALTGHQGTMICVSNSPIAAVEIRSVFGNPMISSMPVSPVALEAATAFTARRQRELAMIRVNARQ